MSDLRFRNAHREDIPFILANETSAYEVPWTKQALVDSLHEQYRFKCLIAGERIVGHLILHPILDECHLLNICIHPRYQGKGWGKATMQYWERWAKEQEMKTLLLEVRASNEPAQQLYRQFGFKVIGVRNDYYPLPQSRREDGIVMAKTVIENDT